MERVFETTQKLAQLALQKIDSQLKMASFTEMSKQLDSIQDMNPTLKNEINYVERYQSKDNLRQS